MDNEPNKRNIANDEDLMLVLKDLRTAMQLITDTMIRHDDELEKKLESARKLERYRVAAFFFGLPCAALGMYIVVSLLIQAIR